MSPPVKGVPAEDAKPQTTGSGIGEPLSLDSLRALSLPPDPAVPAEKRPSQEYERASRTSSRRTSFHMDTANSFEEDTLGTVPDPSHRVSLDMMGAPEGSAIASMFAKSGAASAFAAGPVTQLGTADRTRSEAAFMEAEPLQMTVKKRQPRRPSVQPVPEAPRVTVTAERTRSEIAFDEALPLERPRARSKQPAAAAASAPAATAPATWDNAVPLELTRKRGGAPAAVAPAAAASPAATAAAPEEKAGAWEAAVPLESSKRKAAPSSQRQADAPPGPSVEPAPQPRASSRSARSSRGRSPPPAQVGDFSDEAEFPHDPDLARDDREPLMHNLVGRYSLESSGTERYDLYIDRAAAYAKAQEGVRTAALAAVRLLALVSFRCLLFMLVLHAPLPATKVIKGNASLGTFKRLTLVFFWRRGIRSRRGRRHRAPWTRPARRRLFCRGACRTWAGLPQARRRRSCAGSTREPA